MYLFVTRSFPPELGGMQSLMWGLARELSKNFMIKVYVHNIIIIQFYLYNVERCKTLVIK